MNSQLKRQDILVISMAMVSLLLSCLIATYKRQLWVDEIFTFNLVTDHSLSHMLTALSHHADGGFPFYYILMWGWIKAFGSSELVMRIFSSICICLSFLIVWKILRGIYDFWPVAITTTFIFFTTRQLVFLGVEVRHYGLFLLFCTLGLWQYMVLMDKGEGYSWRDLLINAGIQGAMVLTHAFGFVYSGIFLLSFLVCDRSQRIFRPKVYLSVILGWACFIPWLAPFLIQKDLARPHNWIPVPELKELIEFYSTGAVLNLPILLILLFIYTNLLFFLSVKGNKYKFITPQADAVNARNYRSVLVVGIFLVIIPPIFAWIFSRMAVTIFLPKYMSPSLLGWIIIITYYVNTTLPITQEKGYKGEPTYGFKSKLNFIYSTLVGGFFLFLLLGSLNRGLHFDDIKLYDDLPVAFTKPTEFLPRAHYFPNNRRYFFILDWDAAIDKNNGLSPIVDYKLFSAIKIYYPHYNIIQSNEFLSKYDRFLIFDDDKHNQWAKIRIISGHNYKCTSLTGNIMLAEKIYHKYDNN